MNARIKQAVSRTLFRIENRIPALKSHVLWQRLVQTKWQDVEHFDTRWRGRIELMAELIPAGTRVADFGCGEEWLKTVIGADRYIGVDYAMRSADTVVCDLNKQEFPPHDFDVAFISGALEFIAPYEWFADQIASRAQYIVISYCTLEEVPELSTRRRSGWVNDLSRAELIDLFGRREFELMTSTAFSTGSANNQVFRFDRRSQPASGSAL